MKFTSDIDIDLADRDQLLGLIKVTPAAIRKDGLNRRHGTGVHPTDIPYDPITDTAAVDYRDAEDRGYIKLDLLNIWVYKWVKDENHLLSLMREPDWSKLLDRDFFEKLIHVGNHYDSMLKMPEPINSIPRMAMFLGIIRPAKRHLIGKSWGDVAKTVWLPDPDAGYAFKKSHSLAYSNLVVINMNLLTEDPTASFLQG